MGWHQLPSSYDNKIIIPIIITVSTLMAVNTQCMTSLLCHKCRSETSVRELDFVFFFEANDVTGSAQSEPVLDSHPGVDGWWRMCWSLMVNDLHLKLTDVCAASQFYPLLLNRLVLIRTKIYIFGVCRFFCYLTIKVAIKESCSHFFLWCTTLVLR